MTFPLPASAPSSDVLHQPFVHDRVGVFDAPWQAWSAPDGSMRVGAQGVHCGDTRILRTLMLQPEPGCAVELSSLSVQVRSAREVELIDVVSVPGTPADPLILLRRIRRADANAITETLRLTSVDDAPCTVRLRLMLAPDRTPLSAVKDPRLTSPEAPLAQVEGPEARWSIGEGAEAHLSCSVPLEAAEEGREICAHLNLSLPGPGTAEATWTLTATDPSVPFCSARPAPAPVLLAPPAAHAERSLAHDLLVRSLSDLDALRLQTPGHPKECFLAAGAPWFFTLFGRDSLIAASFALPVDRATAIGTLRTLAARQGTRVDPATAEQPGKILHEVRATGIEMADAHLPPVYYGTIDATPLWIELLHEVHTSRAADDPSVTAELAAPLRAAALWLLEHADADGDGFLEYIDESGHGLANQGWKDSGDSIRFADGSLATGSIALAEVQGYAYAAAMHATDLLTELGDEADADLCARLRSWATELRDRFRAQFWCTDEQGPYVALALDGAKQRVDSVASNMGHLLGTGLLDPQEEAIVAARLMDPTMFSGFGIRTLSTANAAYWPLRYHGGSVWSHDTGMILRGMLRTGFDTEARVLARGLLRAAEGFDLRLPELFSGQGVDEVSAPVPYPASCRPQAWAAATAVPIAQALGVL